MIGTRWIAFAVACLLVAAAAFGAGAGTVALFSESETISGTFSVSDGQNATGDISPSVATPGKTSDAGNGSDPGIGTNGSDVGNSTPGDQNDTAGDDGTGANEAAEDDGATGENGSTAGNASDGEIATAEIEVTGIALSEADLGIGEEVDVAVSAQNTGNATGTFDATLAVNGTESTDGSLELSPGEKSTLTLRHAFDAPGTYVLSVDDVAVGTVEVVEPSGNSTS